MKKFYKSKFFQYFKKNIKKKNGHNFSYKHFYIIIYESYFERKCKYFCFDIKCDKCESSLYFRIPMSEMFTNEKFDEILDRESECAKTQMKKISKISCDLIIIKNIQEL